MNDDLRNHLDALENDPEDEDAYNGLEDVLTGDDDVITDPDTPQELERRRRRLAEWGEWAAVIRILELELLVAGELGDESKEVETTFELGRTYLQKLQNQREGLNYLEKVLALDEDHQEAKKLHEEATAIREKWQDFVERFRDEATQATESSLRTKLFYRAAEVLVRNDPSETEEVLDLLAHCLEADPKNQDGIDLLTHVQRAEGNWNAVAEAHFNASQASVSKDDRLRYLKSAARTYASRARNDDMAADLFRQVLEAVPGHQSAMTFLADYYDKKSEWDELVALYEDALKARPRGEAEIATLLQIGMVHWRMRQDLDAAEEYFGRLRKSNPTHQGMLQFYREYCEQKGDHTKLLQVLADGQRTTRVPEEKLELSMELAKVAEEGAENFTKAIDGWKQVLRLDKENQEARVALRRLYESAGQWNALLDLLKGNMEALEKDDIEGRVAVQLEIVGIYRDKLNHDPMVIQTYNAILKIDPENGGALTELSSVFEGLGRWSDLTRILERRAELADNETEKTELLGKVASLWIDRFNNLNKAVGPLEQILEIDPDNSDAIAQLKVIYAKRRAWKPLYAILQKEVASLEGDEHIERLAEMAKLAAERLDKPTEAVELWERVFEADPEWPNVLDELERLTERQKDWEGLARVLERRLHGANESELVPLLIKLGTVYSDRLQDPTRSAEKWRRVLELQPGHHKAVRVLKDAYVQTRDFEALEGLYESLDEWEALVEVLSTVADKEDEEELKIELSFKAARIFEEKIEAPGRAQRSYERVLTVDEKNERAALALLGIYREGGHWSRLLGVHQILLEHVEPGSEEQLDHLVQLRDLCAERLGDRTEAFRWASKAYDVAPGRADLRDALEERAGDANAWEELLLIYELQTEESEDDEERLELYRRMARINAERLGQPEVAVKSFEKVLELHPGDDEALGTLENIYAASAQFDELLGVFQTRFEMAEEDEQRCSLLKEMARIHEEGLEDSDSAAAAFRQVLELQPDDEEALAALERMATEGERWQELVDILVTRREYSEGDESVDITFQLSRLYSEKLDQPASAIEELRSVLDENPGHHAALDSLEPFLDSEELQGDVALLMEPHLQQNEDFPRLARVLVIILENEEEPDARVELYKRLANIQQDELDQLPQAMESLGSALELAPADRDLWDQLDPLAELTDQNEILAEKLSTAYRSEDLDDISRTDLAARLAEIYDIRLGELEKAREFHEHVLEADPAAHRAFEALENLFNSTEKWDEILDLYRRQSERIDDPSQQRELLLKICFIYEDVLEQKDDAIEWYVRVLDIDPEDDAANAALENLYAQTEKWRELADLLETKLGRAEGDRALELRYQLGELLQTHLDDPSNALDYYEEVLHTHPTHVGAQSALEGLLENSELRQRVAAILEPIYEDQDSSAELARVLEVQLEEVGDPLGQVQLLSRIGALLEHKLERPIEAFEAYARAFEAEPTDAAPRDEMRRLASAQELFERYCAVLEGGVSTATDDVVLQSDLLQEVASLYEVRLDDSDRAEDAYRRLLDVDPDNPDTTLQAARALESLYLLAENWDSLVDILRLRAQFSHEPDERRELLSRVAEIQEADLDRPADAITTFREILDVVPDDISSLNHLERLFERTEDWEELVSVLRRKIELSTDDDEKRELHFTIADLYEDRLDNIDDAILIYHTILTDLGPDRKATRSLVRLYERSERWLDLLEALESDFELCESDDEKAELLCRMGSLHRDQLEEPGRAVDRYKQVVEIDVTHFEAREALVGLLEVDQVKLEAAQVLAPIYDMENEWEKLIGVLELQAEEAMTPAEKWEKLHEASDVAEVGLEDPVRAFDLMGRALQDAAGEPHATEIVEGLERLATPTERHDDLVKLLGDVVLDILDGELQLRVMLYIASTAHHELEKLDVARDYYVQILDTFGDHVQSMDALEEIYRTTEAYEDLLEIYRRKTNLSSEEDERRRLLLLQAELCEEQLENLPEAMSAYESILDMGVDRESTDALERLYEQTERYPDLADLLERQLGTADGAQTVVLHYRLGELHRNRLEDPDMAIDHYRTALEGDPRHQPSVSALETLMDDDERRGIVAEMLHSFYKKEMDWPKLVEAIEARLDSTPDAFERKELLKEMGTIYEEQLDDLEKAFDTFARMFQEDVEDPKSRDLLSRLANNLDCWPQLAGVYSAALDDVLADTEGTTELALVLGEIYDVHCDDYEKAKDAYRRVLAFDPEREEAFKALEGLFQRTAAWHDLLELYREAADRSLDPDIQKNFLFKMADTQEGMLDDRAAAIDIYSEVMNIDEQDERAVAALDRLYYYEQRWADLADLFLRRIDQADDERNRNELRCQLGGVYEERLEDLDAAIDHYEAVLDSDPDHVDALSALERLIKEEDYRFRIAKVLEPIYEMKDDWQRLVFVYAAELDYIAESDERVRLRCEIARLHEERGGDIKVAFDALAAAFADDPNDEDILRGLLRLADERGAWDALVVALEAGLEEALDTVRQGEILRLIAQTHDRRLGDPRASIKAYTRLLDVEDGDADALDALEGLYTLVSDWQGQIDTLERKAERAETAEDRKNLFRRIGDIFVDMVGDSDKAIDAYRRAYLEDDSDLETIEALEQLYEETEEWVDLIEVLARRLDLEADSNARVYILHRRAEVFDTKLDDEFEATTAYQAVLDESPQDEQAIDALDRLHQNARRWTDLLDILRIKAELAADDEQLIATQLRIGALLEQEVLEPEQAIDTYRAVLEIEPDNEEGLAALERIAEDETYRFTAAEVLEPLLHRAEAWDRLSALKELKLDAMVDPGERVLELRRIAEIAEDGLGDSSLALQAHIRALGEDAADEETHDHLERLADQGDAWASLAEAYEERASQVFDTDQVHVLNLRLGSIYEERLGQNEAAIEAFRRGLDAGVDDSQPLLALDRLYLREEQWYELAEVLERELSMATDPSQTDQLEYRLGSLREERFEDIGGAISSYEAIVERNPDHQEAIVALERMLENRDTTHDVIEVLDNLYRRRGDDERSAELYQIRVDLADNESDKVALLCDLAVLLELKLSQPERALSSLAEAFKLDPGDEVLLEELKRLTEQLGAWPSFVQVIEEVLTSDDLDTIQQRDLGVLAARCYDEQLGDKESAEGRYRQVLELEPENSDVLKALEALLRDMGNTAALVPVLRQRAAAEYDTEEKKLLLREAAEFARGELGNTEIAAECYQTILDFDETAAFALDSLAAIREDEESWEELSELLIQRARYCEDIQEGIRFRHQVATLQAGPLDQPDRAIDTYREILDLDGSERAALGALEHLLTELERWTDLKDVLLRRLDSVQTDEEREAIYLSQADLAEKQFDDPEEAIDAYQAVLDMNPQHEEATDGMERLLAQAERWDTLVELLQTRADRASDLGETELELSLLVRIGDIWEQNLSDQHAAIEIYEKVLARDPNHTRALGALARLHEASGDWDRCAEVLEQAASSGGPAQDVAEMWFRLGRLNQDRREDNDSALTCYWKAVELDPGHVDAVESLRTLLQERGEMQRVAELLESQIGTTGVGERKIELLRDVGEIYLKQLDNADRAVPFLEQARELDPLNKQVLLMLVDVYLGAGRQTDAVPVLQGLIEAEAAIAKGGRSKELAVYHHRLGEALKAAGDLDQAKVEYQAAYKMDLGNVEVLSSLGMLCYEEGDFDQAMKVFRGLLLQRAQSPTLGKADIYYLMGDIYMQQDDSRRAQSMFQRGLESDKEHEDCKRMLDELKGNK